MEDIIWHRKPAADWKEGYPIGNGALAAMVLGGVGNERLALNHELLWRAVHRDRDVHDAAGALPEIRRLFLEGRLLEAGALANERLGGPGGVSGTPNRVDPYQPLGDLVIRTGHEPFDDYRRELDLSRALAAVSYRSGGGRFRREYYAHAGLPVLVARLSGDVPFDATLSLVRVADPACTVRAWSSGRSFGLAGEFEEGVRFAVEARVRVSGGTVAPVPGGLSLAGCREVLVLLSATVRPDGGDPRPACRAQFDGAAGPARALFASHERKHAALYGRVRLELGRPNPETPTDERLGRLGWGWDETGLDALLFNFGRYLLISSSCNAALPANLQGKWNEEVAPPWECDFHHDVNLEMNYWAAEVGALPEAVEPLFRHVERFVPHGRRAARLLYGCRGVWFPIQTDPSGRATPESRGWDVWVGAAAWLAEHFWWRWEYAGDREFLARRAYPYLKEVAAFFEDYLVADAAGRLVPVPSQSPESCFAGGTRPVSLCVGSAMDIALIREVLSRAIEAAETLGRDRARRAVWRRILERMPDIRVGRAGRIMEWLDDHAEEEPGHRHISHLLPLFPGDRIVPETEPALAAAAAASLDRRLAHGGGHSGWSSAWVACCFARLGMGERAMQSLHCLLSRFMTPSLLGLHPPAIFQIDGNFGGAAAVAEMLFQSHRGVLRVLPALPSSWPKGSVSGLRGRGGFTAAIEWEDGAARRVEILSERGGICRVAFPAPATLSVACRGRTIASTDRARSRIEWLTRPGGRYTISCAPPA